MRGLTDRKGELFAYVHNKQIFTLDDELSGRIEGGYVVDLGGKRVWRVVGDGVYMLDGLEPVGYLGSEVSDRYS